MTPTAPAAPATSSHADFLSDLARALVGLVTGIYLAGVACLLLGQAIGPRSALAGLALGLILPLPFRASRRAWLAALVSLGFGAMCVGLSSLSYDNTWDGLNYHQPAVIQLLAGWNPFRDHSDPSGVVLWTAVYPKAAWITGAQVAALTGHVETGKAPQLLLLAAACLVAVGFVARRLPPTHARLATCVGVLAGLNPVALYQATSFLVDGMLASLFTLLVLPLADHVAAPRARWGRFEAACAALLLINLKFTGLVYAGFAIAAAALVLATHRDWMRWLRFNVAWGALFLFAVLLLGRSPYTDNLRAGRHLFYPLMGPKPVDIMTPFRPPNLVQQDRFTRFFISTFSETATTDGGRPARLKWPFTVRASELLGNYTTVRCAGFGPLFSGALVALVAGILLLAFRKKLPFGRASGFLLLAILLTTFAHTEGWWSRYAPQVWLLATLPLAMLLVRETIFLRHIAVAALALNLALLTGLSALGARRLNQRYRAEFATLRQVRQPVELEIGRFPAFARRLAEAGIASIPANEVTGPGWRYLDVPGITVRWRPGLPR